MSIRTLSSGASAWRGYEYYTEKKELQNQLFEALAELDERGRRYYR